MDSIEIVRSETDSMEDIMAMLEGQVFHVTRRAHWPAIVEAGRLEPNRDGRLPTTFGYSRNAFFNNRGCISVFDYRTPPSPEIHDFRLRCHPLQPAQPRSEGIVILFLNPSLHAELVPWTEWKREEAWREMVVPHVEAGYPGPIPLDRIDRAIFVTIEEDPQCYAALVRRSFDAHR